MGSGVFEELGGWNLVVVDECPQYEHDGVHLTDACQELVAQSLAGRRPFDEAPDVGELDASGDHLGGPAHLGQAIQAAIGHLGHPDVRVGRGKRVRGSKCPTAGQGVVQRRLARIRQSYETKSLHYVSRRHRPPTRVGHGHSTHGLLSGPDQQATAEPADPDDWPGSLTAMSKHTSKQRANARRKKANHGRKPNVGRNS